MAAVSKVSLMALIAIIFAVVSVAAQEAPAPSPASPATSIAPSFVSACLAAFVALAFGSTLRIWGIGLLIWWLILPWFHVFVLCFFSWSNLGVEEFVLDVFGGILISTRLVQRTSFVYTFLYIECRLCWFDHDCAISCWLWLVNKLFRSFKSLLSTLSCIDMKTRRLSIRI